MNYYEYLENLSCFLEMKHWVKKECKICGTTFFCKDPGMLNCCRVNNRKTDGKGIKKKKETYLSLYDTIDNYFCNIGYQKKVLPNVHNMYKDTAFVVAAVQRYNHSLEQGLGIDESRIYSPQPCIRLKALTDEQIYNGFLYSFINVATLKIRASMSEYLEYLDDWIGLFSYLGVHASKLIIRVSSQRAKIQSIYQGWNVDIIYNDLELGQCSFFDLISGVKGTYTGIDCGFCMERILWLINGGTIWEQIAPADFTESIYFDARAENMLRTIVLAIMSGICPGAKSDKYHTKKLILELLNQKYNWIFLDGGIEYYYDYWRKYIPVCLPIGDCKRILYTFLRKRLLE